MQVYTGLQIATNKVTTTSASSGSTWRSQCFAISSRIGLTGW
ncbi:hypothetical protein LINPERPRIM_LOCUS17464 [Linum perenne]